MRCCLPPADCPACYDLVQDAVRELRDLLANLTRMIDNIGDDPESIDDADFRSKLRAVNDSVNQLLEDARNAVGELTLRELRSVRHTNDSDVKSRVTHTPVDLVYVRRRQLDGSTAGGDARRADGDHGDVRPHPRRPGGRPAGVRQQSRRHPGKTGLS